MKVAVVTLLVALAACSRTSGPVEIPAEDLPFSVTRTEDPTRTPEAGRSHPVFFVEDGRLLEQRRSLDASVTPALAALQVLLLGPTSEERQRDISTQIPGEVRVLDADVADGTARVDLSGEFQEPAAPEDIALRVAQVVWTLTALPAVGSVSFSIDGEAVAVTTQDGSAVDRPVTREDYSELAPA